MWLVREHVGDYETEWAGHQGDLGAAVHDRGALRKWVHQAEVDAGEAAGVPMEPPRELRDLRRKNRELESTNVILGGVDCLAA